MNAADVNQEIQLGWQGARHVASVEVLTDQS